MALRRQGRQFPREARGGHPDLTAPQFAGLFLNMEFTVYILFSESTSTFYTGSTQNLENRIVEHNQGETKSIKHGIPWEVIWQKQLPTRAEAMQLETKIKKRGAKRFLEDLSRGA